MFATGNKYKRKNWNTLLENSQSKKVHPLLDKKILSAEIFGHISIESSRFEGRFDLIFENQFPINAISFLGYSLMMVYQKTFKKETLVMRS